MMFPAVTDKTCILVYNITMQRRRCEIFHLTFRFLRFETEGSRPKVLVALLTKKRRRPLDSRVCRRVEKSTHFRQFVSICSVILFIIWFSCDQFYFHFTLTYTSLNRYTAASLMEVVAFFVDHDDSSRGHQIDMTRRHFLFTWTKLQTVQTAYAPTLIKILLAIFVVSNVHGSL